MSEFGNTLLRAREKLGLDYEYIHDKTKIHPKVLKALEEEDFDYFTSHLYLKSFLKKYAEFLGVNSEVLLQELEEKISQARQKKEPQVVVSPSLLPPLARIFFGLKVLISLLVVMISIYLLFLGVNKIVGSIIPKKLPPMQEVGVVKEPKQELPTPVKLPLKLTIEVKEDCWFQLRSDDEKIFEGILKKGQRENWFAKREFELWVGEASRLNLFLNDIPLAPLGRGVVKGIKIDSEGLKLP